MDKIEFDMVVLDMAGTTINEDNLVYKTLENSINKYGYQVNLEQVLEEGAGKEKTEAIRSILLRYLDINDESQVVLIYNHFIKALEHAYANEDIWSQPNAKEFLDILKNRNIKVVLNTGYDRKTASAILSKIGWKEGNEFDALVTASDVKKNRPEPDMINYAMRKFNISDCKRVVKVGDSTIDIMEGQNAGCGLSIGITTGAHTAKQLKLANPDVIVNNLLEILPVMKLNKP